MILILFLFMPVAACFGWLIVNYFLARRTNTYGILTALLLVLGLFLITDSTYANPEVKSYHLVYMRLLEVFTAPCIIPLMWMYLYRLKEKEKFKNWHFSWVIVPFILITAGGLITHLKGTDNIAGYLEEVYSGGLSTARIARSQDHLLFAYYLWTGLIYRIVISIELLAGFVMVLYYTRKYRFSFKGFQKFRRKGEHAHDAVLQHFGIDVEVGYVLVLTQGTEDSVSR